jgi:hypothetical protein
MLAIRAPFRRSGTLMSLPRISFSFAIAFLLLLSSALISFSQDLDGPKHIFHDALLDNLAGNWKLAGKIASRSADHTVQAEWVLNHQFLRIHEKDTSAAKDESLPYEAIIMVGYDNTSERYVAHWNDVYGGRFSETLGYGTHVGDEIRLVFEYPDGPFRTTFRWLPDSHKWKWLMQSKTKSGQWTDFADMILSPAPQP